MTTTYHYLAAAMIRPECVQKEMATSAQFCLCEAGASLRRGDNEAAEMWATKGLQYLGIAPIPTTTT
jgi:hypothetical protein